MYTKMIEDAVPGTSRERRVVDTVLNELKENADWSKRIEIPIVKWENTCRVLVDEFERECRTLPYSLSAEIDGKPRVVNDIRELREERDLSDKIVVMRYPGRYIDLRKTIYTVLAKSPGALILVTDKQGLLRINTVLSTPGFTYRPSVPVPIPVICVDKALGEMIKRANRVVVETKSSINDGEGMVVVAGINGSGEDEIHVTSHHDHWFKGVGGSYVGLSALLKLSERIKKDDASGLHNIVLISYTARDIGDKLFTEYHYTWGERYLLKILDNKKKLENVKYAVAIGPIYHDRINAIAHPCFERDLREMLRTGFIDKISRNHVFHESLPYIEKGIPAITLTTIDDIAFEIHNSNMDNEEIINYEYLVDRVVEIVTKLIKLSIPDKGLVANTVEYVKSELEEIPLEAKISVSKLMDISMESPRRGLHALTRIGYGLFYSTCLDRDGHDFMYAGLFPWIELLHGTESVRKTSECDEVILGDVEGYGIYLVKGAIRSLAVDYLFNKLTERYIHELGNRVNRFIMQFLCEKAICGETSGVEKHNDR
ncbi:MAG: hypothetical protein QW278_05665 [Desulfurococcaceae archaeon]